MRVRVVAIHEYLDTAIHNAEAYKLEQEGVPVPAHFFQKYKTYDVQVISSEVFMSGHQVRNIFTLLSDDLTGDVKMGDEFEVAFYKREVEETKHDSAPISTQSGMAAA